MKKLVIGDGVEGVEGDPLFHHPRYARRREMDQEQDLPYSLRPDTVVPIVEARDTSAQRQALLQRAYSTEGKLESLISRVPARVRPTTIARLRLFEQDPHYGYPSLDEAVDEAIHDYLVSMGY